MIPIRLEMYNFLPYRHPEALRFDGIHLACLTGPNGAGKSSLLDAITWALWGEARAKTADALIHQGQGRMRVSLDFIQEDLRYRVTRERQGGRSGKGSLNFFVLPDDDAPRLINEGSMKATQEKINRLLRLDYITFTHSAFLKQGQADAFTTQTPAKRKDILAAILGLDRWKAYEQRAKEQARALRDGLHQLEGEMNEIRRELDQEPALRAELDSAQQHLARVEADKAQAEARLDEVRDAPNALRRAQDQRQERTRRRDQHAQELAAVQAERDQHAAQAAEFESLLQDADSISAGYAALQSARSRSEALSQALSQLKAIDDEAHGLQSALDRLESGLRAQVSQVEARMAGHQARIDADPAAQAQALRDELAALEARDAEKTALSEAINALNLEKNDRENQLKVLEDQGKKNRQRIATLHSSDAPTCPTCGQPLSETHRAQVIADIEADTESMRDDYRDHQARLKAITEEVRTAQDAIRALDLALGRRTTLTAQLGRLDQQAADADAARDALAAEAEQLAVLHATLSSGDYGHAERARLAELEAARDVLGYDEQGHADARQRLTDYARYEALHQRLSVAQQTLPALQAALTGDDARIARLVQAMAAEDAALEALAAEIKALGVQAAEYEVRQKQLTSINTEWRHALEQFNRRQQEIDSLDVQRQRLAEKESAREAAQYQKGLADELVVAFGKNGVPAMMIESAIPELEHIANELLGRMTDGRMHLRLNTQRERLKGGTAETLEIEIADELGTRPYEMYSGGESFRIDFALRVALSKLLARRAGAHLRTLFIDEGFGTQDAAGREKLVEAINAIRDDFAMILVITHIDELRDAFPVHIIIDKGPGGSRVRIQ